MLDLIGITGLKQSGKNTAAEVLTAHLDFTPDALADDIKAIVYSIEGVWVAVPPDVLPTASGFLTYQEVIDRLGLDQAKELVPDVRRILQTFGTEGIRTHFGPDVWSARVLERITQRRALPKPVRTVVTDVRYPDEAQMIRDAGGIMLRVVRPGLSATADSHKTETLVSGLVVDVEIVNDGSIEQLHARTLEAVLEHAAAVDSSGNRKTASVNTATTHEDRLYIDQQGGGVECFEHLGRYGQSAVAANPAAESWVTPLDVWTVASADDNAAWIKENREPICCDTCCKTGTW